MTSNSSKIITNDQTGQFLKRGIGEERENETTQKITLPIFEKTIQEAKLWWRRFIQYVKKTQDIDLTITTNDKELLAQYREELEIKIKDIFIWALDEAAVSEMTKSPRKWQKSFLPKLFLVFFNFTLHYLILNENSNLTLLSSVTH